MYLLILTIILFIALYFFFICPRLSKRDKMICFRHVLFAHRGYHCLEHNIPENSIPAFNAAIKNGYGIELDIHLTKDGTLVVFHDNTLERMCGCPGTIEEMTWEQLRHCHLHNSNEGIPLFTDVLSLVNGQVPLLIELKIPTKSLAVCQAAAMALKNYHGPFMVQSFNTMGIRWFKLHYPEILRGQLSSNLLKSSSPEPAIFKWLVKHLLVNCLGRPDFISYKLADLPSPGVSILRRIFHTTTAVWTLRTTEALKQGLLKYEIQIFEKQSENY